MKPRCNTFFIVVTKTKIQNFQYVAIKKENTEDAPAK